MIVRFIRQGLAVIACHRADDESLARIEQQEALDKGELFEQVLERKLVIEWNIA